MHWWNLHSHMERFYKERLEDWSKRIRGVGLEDAVTHAQVLAGDAVRDFAAKPYGEFEKVLVTRIKRLHAASKRKTEPVFAAAVYREMPRERAYAEKMRDVELNLKHARKWKKQGTQRIGPYSFRPDFFRHLESFMALRLQLDIGAKPIPIAAAGFRLLSGPRGETILSINNVQGERDREAELKEFTYRTGESWRDALVKRLISHAKAHGFGVHGEVPAPGQVVLLLRQEQVPRLAAEYEKTFHRLGFKKKGGHWELAE